MPFVFFLEAAKIREEYRKAKAVLNSLKFPPNGVFNYIR
jgi:hypothetical protein